MRRRRGFAIRVVLAVASALGVLAAMGEPWYGPPPAAAADAQVTLTLPFEALASDLSRWLREPSGTSAWESFQRADAVLAALMLCAGGGAIGCLAPATERAARSALQLASVAALVVVMVKLVDHPGPNGLSEPRYGLFMAAAGATLLLVCASGIVTAPLEASRRAAARRVRI